MIPNGQYFDELRVSDISVISGVRSFGRTVDYSGQGRKSSGFLFVWEGEATFTDDGGKEQIVSNGELAFLPKYKKYSMKYTAPSTVFVVVNFELRDRNDGAAVLFDDICLVATDDASQRIARTMTSFELCNVSKTIGAVLRKKELLYRLLGLVYSSGFCLTEGRAVSSPIADGVLLLEQTYLENLPIAQYAAASHVSVNTFRTWFQKQFGMSPIKYRNYLRIERARELLSEGGFTVAEVAYASGFENIGYFCRYYRRITGESPGETKKRTQSDGA